MAAKTFVQQIDARLAQLQTFIASLTGPKSARRRKMIEDAKKEYRELLGEKSQLGDQ